MLSLTLLCSGVYCGIAAARGCAAILPECTALVMNCVHMLMQICFRNDTAHNSNPDACSDSH